LVDNLSSYVSMNDSMINVILLLLAAGTRFISGREPGFTYHLGNAGSSASSSTKTVTMDVIACTHGYPIGTWDVSEIPDIVSFLGNDNNQ
jgi:hypothetical protein